MLFWGFLLIVIISIMGPANPILIMKAPILALATNAKRVLHDLHSFVVMSYEQWTDGSRPIVFELLVGFLSKKLVSRLCL